MQSGKDNFIASNETLRHQNGNIPVYVHVLTAPKTAMCEADKITGQSTNASESTSHDNNSCTEMGFTADKSSAVGGEFCANGKVDSDSSNEKTVLSGGTKFKKPPYTLEPSKYLSQKSAMKGLRENLSSSPEMTSCLAKESSTFILLSGLRCELCPLICFA